MTIYLARRLLHALLTVLGVALLVFALFHFFAPDPAYIALGQHASPSALADLRAQWGLDRPLPQQFLEFLGQILRNDYGRTLHSGRPVTEALAGGALVSLSVTLPPFLAASLVSVALGMLSAEHLEGWLDRSARAVATAAMSVSVLVYAAVFQYLLAYRLGLFPVSGHASGLGAAAYLALPWLILLLLTTGPDLRLYRSVFAEIGQAEYVRTARALGASQARLRWRTQLPNALGPILTQTVTSLPFLLLGSFVLERFFAIPGIGHATVMALEAGDLPTLKAVTMWGAMSLVVANLFTDLLYAWVDPRVRLG